MRRPYPGEVLDGAIDLVKRRRVAGSKWLGKVAEASASAQVEYRATYDEYVSSVSSPDMAVSLESVGALAGLCRVRKAKAILDLGSGFSTYVLAREAEKLDAVLVSLEDHDEWRAKTEVFLKGQGVDVDLRPLSDGYPQDRRFDLVFHDLGSMETRIGQLSNALGAATGGGVVLLDDFHKPHYRYWAKKVIIPRHRGMLVPVKKLTHDRLGRYAALWIRSNA